MISCGSSGGASCGNRARQELTGCRIFKHFLVVTPEFCWLCYHSFTLHKPQFAALPGRSKPCFDYTSNTIISRVFPSTCGDKLSSLNKNTKEIFLRIQYISNVNTNKKIIQLSTQQVISIQIPVKICKNRVNSGNT